MQLTHEFSIQTTLRADTKQPYGPKYAGTFSIRRPSIQDKYNAAAKNASLRCAFGHVPEGAISEGLETIVYMICFVEAIATKQLPDWFKAELIFDESDEAAVGAVWAEVQTFLKTFRHQEPVGNSGAGS